MNAPAVTRAGERDLLLKVPKRAARPKRKRAIVCYDAKWAGLPPITVYARPRRRKGGYVKYRPRKSAVVHRPAAPPVRQSAQLELAL